MSERDGGDVIADGEGQQATSAEVRRTQPVGEVLSQNQQYIKRVAALFAVAGLGLGLAAVFLGEFGSPPLEISGENVPPTEQYHTMMVGNMATGILYYAPLLVVGLAALVGSNVPDQFSTGREGFITSGVASAAGTVVLMLVAGLLLSSQFPDGSSEYTFIPVDGLSYGGLLTNAVLLAIVASIVTVGTAYALIAFDD